MALPADTTHNLPPAPPSNLLASAFSLSSLPRYEDCCKSEREKKKKTKSEQRENKGGEQQGFLRCLGLHPLAQRGQRGTRTTQQTWAESHYFSPLFFSRAVNSGAFTLHARSLYSKRSASLAAGADDSLSPKRFNSARGKKANEVMQLQHNNI